MSESEQYLSSAAVLEKFDISRATLYRWINERKFPLPVTINGLKRWRASEIKNFEDKSTQRK